MPMAARLGDMTAHGTPLGPGPGSADVLIGGMPAWRAAADFHSCPLFNGPGSPHAGGVVSTGSATVFINGMPAARQGDPIAEAGPANLITAGCPTVMVG